MEDLKWDDLRLFLEVARTGTLAAAGDAVGLSASTVHRRIAALEETLGDRLFHKAPRGYTLTPLGESLMPRAEAVAEAVYGLARAATGHDGRASGTVRVTVTADLLPLLAPHMDTLHTACPGVVPVLLVAHRLVDLGRDADIALRVSAEAPDDTIAHRIGTSVWCRYARVDDPTLPWVAYEGRDLLATRWWRRVHGDAPVIARVDDIGSMAHLLASLPAQGLLPEHVGDAMPGLVRVGEPIVETATPIWVLVHVDLRRSARVRAFLDVVLPAMAQTMA